MPITDTTEPDRYRNFYHHCGEEWQMDWSCMCNDRCPTCNTEVEPHHSEDIEE